MNKRVGLIALGAILAVMATGCGDSTPRVTIAAASDVRMAFEEMEPGFEASCDCDLVFSFGSSGTLRTQIEEGLPVDAFFSANEAYVNELEDRGLIVPETKQLYAVGRIVLASRSGAPTIEDLEGLVSDDVKRIALPNPDHAPYGTAGKEALQATGIWNAVEPKLVIGENASAATAFVQGGDADAGILPLSLAIQDKSGFTYVLIDDLLHEPLRQTAAVVAAAEEKGLADDFINYVNGPGRETMRRYGFVLPGEAAP